ncbi:MAG: ATP-binding cassette domain-containing protein [Streptosporangiaceae bacterium]|jgi:ABC-type multidrug transport system ATPase subunit/signal transduction histidine kinase
MVGLTVAAPASPPASVAEEPLLTIRGLSARFGPVRALENVNLDVRPGELVALAGENGAGKTTLVRCVAGDVSATAGEITFAGKRVRSDPVKAAKQPIAVVWQDLALCDNLDVAGNIMLGRETRRLMLSDTRLHAKAAEVLSELGIPLSDTTRNVRSLSGGQRQLVAVARAMGRKPRLLALDEPTASLGVRESKQVEDLIQELHKQGTTILLACHDIDQMFRVADRIVVLRQGKVIADLEPARTHPDDVVALLSGQEPDATARRQLTRLHGLTGRLTESDPSNSLSLILSALGAALGAEYGCIHLTSGRVLNRVATLGFSPDSWARLPYGLAGGAAGVAAEEERPVIGEAPPEIAASTAWSVPVLGPGGVSGVITIFRPPASVPQRDELDLVTVYAGYAASAIERDRLLDQVTTRNRVLETIRDMLETLAGPVPVAEGLTIALRSLRRGLQADEVMLLTLPDQERAYAGQSDPTPELRTLADRAARQTPADGVARELPATKRRRYRAVAFPAPGGASVLIASWRKVPTAKEETSLLEDAANSLRLALEREEAGVAHAAAAALRRSRELQRGFLSRLSHELRTPLTAIRGYASSLMQPDVTWDGDSQRRFLERIAAESARLGRLVDDLLDFNAIESGILRLQRDWCDPRLVLEAAIACLPPSAGVHLDCPPDLPPAWGDHDRLEQVFVNLLGNAAQHNPPGTTIAVTVAAAGDQLEITVEDDGTGMPPPGTRSRTAGAGLGLSIAKAIVAAHGGTLDIGPAASKSATPKSADPKSARQRGTRVHVLLPIETDPPAETQESPDA